MSYRELATRPTLTWSLVTVAARSPIAMAPLALVFLVRERPGGYGLGAALAAAYVVGEVAGALLLGPRLTPGRARTHMAAGLLVGGAAFAALGVFPYVHPLVLGAFAVLAGVAPAASPGGLRTMLLALVPEGAAAQAVSAESVLTYGIWAAAPALATGLALGADPSVPLLLAAVLVSVAAAGLWALPPGWKAGRDDTGEGLPVARLLATGWPVYVSGAAAVSLLALAELVLPALLEQRSLAVGWAGPLLAGYSVAAAGGALVYGLRSWPGRIRTQSLVLLLGVSGCLALAAVVPPLAGIAAALLAAGVLQSGVQVTRSLALREVLPARALAAGFSVMYAAAGGGYVVSAILSGAVLGVASPSAAILAGVALTLVLTGISWLGERRRPGPEGHPGAGISPEESVPGLSPPGGGAEGAPIDGRRDAERGL
ncbi:MFS transporter [Streptomyces sp. NPDC051219]|uniref:MFS transporter n=1 Tax=Streptomyces sp. NPDC051219 TaxID=3155283 RepID=UPI00343B2364